MSEVRLTFAATDFGAVSEALINMGVSFRVDPLRAAVPVDPDRAAPAAPARAQTRRKAPAARKTPAAGKAARVRETRPASAADRLREAITRSQPPAETPAFPLSGRTPEEE